MHESFWKKNKKIGVQEDRQQKKKEVKNRI